MASVDIVARRFSPGTIADGWMTGNGKHFIVCTINGFVYFVGGDWATGLPQPNTVASAPQVQGGRQEIVRYDLNTPKHTARVLQGYWPQRDKTGGYLMWNPDDGGGVVVKDKIWVFRSTGVGSNVPAPGAYNYPPAGVGELIGTANNPRIGIYDPASGHWSPGPLMPGEMASNRCWGGVYDEVVGEVLFFCEPRRVVRIRVSDGMDISSRTSNGVLVDLGSSAQMDGPHSCQWHVPRGFLADGPNGEGLCAWTWDTQNHYLCAIILSKLRAWNGNTWTNGIPVSRIRKIPEKQPYSNQANTSLTYDEATSTICVWGMEQPGHLYTIGLKDVTNSKVEWTVHPRPDRLQNNAGTWLFCQRHVYIPPLKETFCFGMADFSAATQSGFPYWLVKINTSQSKTNLPKWLPKPGHVRAIAGTAENPSRPMDAMPGSGPWNKFGTLNPQGMFSAWNSACYNSYGPDELGTAAYAGGGDGDWPGSNVIALGINHTTVKWRSMVEPANFDLTPDPKNDNLPIGLDRSSGEVKGTEVVFAPHTYDNMTLLSPDETGNKHGAFVYPVVRYVWGAAVNSLWAHKCLFGLPEKAASKSAWSRASNTMGIFRLGDSLGTSVHDSKKRQTYYFQTGISALAIDQIHTLTNWKNGKADWGAIPVKAPVRALRANPTALFWGELQLVVMIGVHPERAEFSMQVFDLESK